MLLDASRKDYATTMESLDPVHQHRTILLVEDVTAHFDCQVRSNRDQVAVERLVMQITERQTIGDDRFTTRMGVGKDVSRGE